MTRTGITWLCAILIAGVLTVAWWADQRARQRDSAPAGQSSQIDTTTRDLKDFKTLRDEITRGKILTYSTDAYDLRTRQPKPEAFYALQWLADGVRCPVTDNVSLMASCILQRYGKMRDKALSARARYEALVGLERAYWAALAREGLTQKVEHVPVRGGSNER